MMSILKGVRSRRTLFPTCRFDEHGTGFLDLLSSGLQFGNLDNSDTSHNDTGSLSGYTAAAVKPGYRFSKLIRASFGIDNLTNENDFIGPHSFPQRTCQAGLRTDAEYA
jgi:iron complex outermembrane receptor protein